MDTINPASGNHFVAVCASSQDNKLTSLIDLHETIAVTAKCFGGAAAQPYFGTVEGEPQSPHINPRMVVIVELPAGHKRKLTSILQQIGKSSSVATYSVHDADAHMATRPLVKFAQDPKEKLTLV